MRRLLAVLGVMMLVTVACGDDDKATTTATTAGGNASKDVTIQVDNESDAFNFQAIAYFPDKATVAAGSTVKFDSHFRGEPHTVTFGSSVDKLLGIFDNLPDEQKEGPPPPEAQALKVPFVFPDDADFSDLVNLKFNQSAAQPCFLAADTFAPGADPCPKAAAPKFDGSQPFYNSGLLKDDEVFELPLADNIAPGTYQFICLFHGPEMRGSLTVAGSPAEAQSADAVDTAGKQALDDLVGKIQPEIDKAKTEAKPGEVKAGASAEESPAGAIEFFPEDVAVPVNGTVTWSLSFHTVSFNAPEDARPDVLQEADGTWKFNAKTFTPVGYEPPEPPSDEGGGPGGDSDTPPPPVTIDGGKWNGTGFYNSGSIDAPGDVLFKLTFTKAGTYEYICLLHPDMEGTVKVG